MPASSCALAMALAKSNYVSPWFLLPRGRDWPCDSACVFTCELCGFTCKIIIICLRCSRPPDTPSCVRRYKSSVLVDYYLI